MLTRTLLFLASVSAAVTFAACGGEPAAATNATRVPASASPQAAPPVPVATPPPPLTASMETSVGGVARPDDPEATIGDAETPVLPTAPGPDSTAAPQKTATAEVTRAHTADVAVITRMVEDYWGAFNAYDADLALSMLEPSYRADEDELIRRDIGRMKLFRVKLDVSEETPLRLTESGDYEIYLRLSTPVDTRRVKMVFRRIEDRWAVVFSDEVK